MSLCPSLALGENGVPIFQVNNADRAGPTSEELRRAAEENAYGLVLTRVTADSFCAHYFNPKGLVISLGSLPPR